MAEPLARPSWLVMFTTALSVFLLFLSQVFAGVLVSDVYSSQSQCDSAVDIFKNKNGETPCTVVLDLLVPCHMNVSESSNVEISASACACNVAFYNLLSACVLFCVKGLGVDPFYKWSDGCNLVVPMTRDYPFKAVVTTDIPPWASKQLSSSGSFDPSVVMRGQWTTIQKLTPVIVGLGVLILVGLIWYFYRTYRRRKYSPRAQGMYSVGHRRNASAGSYSSTSHLNPNRLSLPVHRIRFFFSGMLPVRERRRSLDWNIEGEPELPRRSSATYNPPSHRESESFIPAPSVHTQNDSPPASPATPWSPFQTISRLWVSAGPSKGKDYQAVHLLPARKYSKSGTDDDNLPEPTFIPPPSQNRGSNARSDRTSREGITRAVAASSGGRASGSRIWTPQPETEPPRRERLPSLRPNRPGRIVAIEDPPPSQLSPSADAPTTTTPIPHLPPPPGVRPQESSDTFHTSYTTLSTDGESGGTVKPRKLSPELLFPPSVRAAGYSILQRPDDRTVRAWIPRVDGTSDGPAGNPPTEPPSHNQIYSPTVTVPRPLSPTSTHPYPYTNHPRSTSDIVTPDVSRSPRPHLQDIDTQEAALNRLSLAVNGPTSPLPTSENGSGDGYTDFTPVSIVHGADALKNLEYTPYPSSTMLPSSTTGLSRGDHLRLAER